MQFPVSHALFISGWLLFAFWLVALLPGCLMTGLRTLRRVGERRAVPERWPAVSVIVPARNEGAKVAACLAALRVLDYPDLEVVAVDDRSTDDTAAHMHAAAAVDPRLRVLQIETLPPEWLGKNHALHTAAGVARGEWLLFTDGDVVLCGDVLRRAVRVAQADQLGLLSLLPSVITGGYAETALVAFFGLLVVAGQQTWLARSRLRWAYMGVGAFNLVERAAYQAAGGHLPIRLDVLDDVKLAKLIKRAGFRTDLLAGEAEVRVRWQESFGGVIRGLEKNAFAAANYSLIRLVLLSLLVTTLLLGPYLAVAVLPAEVAAGFWATLCLLHGLYALSAWGMGATPLVALALPFAAIVMIVAFWRSAVMTLRQGGVRWRETFYPLELLRRHIYR